MFALVSLFLLFGCGKLDSLLSSNGTYQVKVLVNGGSLEECSLVRADDQIRPYFANSVVNDPDLTGLRFFLKNEQGEIAGTRFCYVLGGYVQGAVEPESAMEASGDESPAVPDGDAPAETTENADLVVAVKSLSFMPLFAFPANLAIGSYTLVFQALGGNEVLDRTEINVFYLGNAQFSLTDIQVYFPGFSSGSRLIPPGTTVMLEACLDFDTRLDPYIVWYNGKNSIGEGKFSDGAEHILWEAPEQTGFHSIRAEVFPRYLDSRFAGSSREMAIAVSQKTSAPGYFFGDTPVFFAPAVETEGGEALAGGKTPDASAEVAVIPAPPPELRHWYQFGGNLKDSKTPLATDRALVPMGEKPSRWMPVGNAYGLLVDSEMTYALPTVNFIRKTANSAADEESGGGQFLLRVKALSEGKIFSAAFASKTSAGEDAEINLFLSGNDLVLALSAAGASPVKIPLSLTAGESNSYITAVINFFIRPYRLEASLGVGESPSRQSKAQSISLSTPLNGEGRLMLGGGVSKLAAKRLTSSEQAAAPAFSVPAPVNVEPAETGETAIYSAEAGETLADIFPIGILPDESLAADIGDAVVGAGSVVAVPAAIPAAESGVFPASAVWDEFAVLYSTVPLIAESKIVPEESLSGKENGNAENLPAARINPAAEAKPPAAPNADEPRNAAEGIAPNLEPVSAEVPPAGKKNLTNEPNSGADESSPAPALKWAMIPVKDKNAEYSDDIPIIDIPINLEALDSDTLNRQESQIAPESN